MSLAEAISNSPVRVSNDRGIVVISRGKEEEVDEKSEICTQGEVVALDAVTREVIGRYNTVALAAVAHNISHLLVIQSCDNSIASVDVPIVFSNEFSTSDITVTTPIAFKYKSLEEKFLMKYSGPFNVNDMVLAREHERSQNQYMAKVLIVPEYAHDLLGNESAITVAWETQNFKRGIPLNPSLCQPLESSSDLPRKRAKKASSSSSSSQGSSSQTSED